MTATELDNIKFDNGTISIYIGVFRIENNITNTIKVIPQPATDSTERTLILNLNKIEDRFTINGYINEGKLNDSETYSTAKDKKDGLRSISTDGTQLTMTYDDSTITGNIEKLAITENAIDKTVSDGEIRYDLIITFIKGDVDLV